MTVCAPAAGPRRVLMIHSFGRDFAPFAAISSGFRTELAQQSPEPVEVQEASLETALFAEGQREETVVEYLRVLLGGRKPDLVVTFGAPAGGFWLRHREAVLPSTPALIAAMDQRRLPDVPLGADVTTVSFSLDLPGAVEHILRVVPGTTNITVALGASATEKYWEAEAKAAFQAFTNRLAFNWLNQLPLGEMQKRVASLPPRSAILYGGIALDANGVPYEQDRPLAALHAAANTPIFGFFDNLLGRGIVGGPLIPIQEMSQETARVAVRILGRASL
jgi:hypothetical protein